MPRLGADPTATHAEFDTHGVSEKWTTSWTASETFIARSMGIKHYSTNDSGDDIIGIVYDSVTGAFLGKTAPIPGNNTTHWVQVPLISSVSIVSGTIYKIGILAAATVAHMYEGDVTPATYNTDAAPPDDPFGSFDMEPDHEVAAYVTSNIIVVSSLGDLSAGAAVVEAGDGNKLAAFSYDYGGVAGSLRVYEDIDSIPSLVDSDTDDTVFGSASAIWKLDAAIDSNNDIHIVAVATSATATRNIAYCILDIATGFGTWELVANFSEGLPSIGGVSISIDGNDKPHVLFVDTVKMTGSIQDNVYYTEKTGASWSTPTQIGQRAVKTDFYHHPHITLKGNDYIETFYYGNTSSSPTYTTRKNVYMGAWSGEIDHTTQSTTSHGIVVTTGGTVYRLQIDVNDNMYIDDSDTGYNTYTDYIHTSGLVLVDTVRYIFYIDSNQDVRVISNDDGGWTDEGALQVGTYDNIVVEWAYNNENQSDEINYIFEDGGVIYWDAFSLADNVDDLIAVGITATPVVGTPTIGQEHDLTAVGIITTPVLGTPIVSEIINLTAIDIISTPVLGTPIAARISNLIAVGIITTPVLDTSTIGQTHVLVSVGVTTTPVVGTSTIGQKHALDIVGITADPVLGVPIIGQTHPLVSVGITTTPVLDTLTMGQTHVLVSVGITITPVLGTPTIGQEHFLISVGIISTPVLDIPTLGQTHPLDAVGITSTPVLDTPTVTSTADLISVGITADPVLDTPSVGQEHVLDSVGITADPVLGVPIIGQTHPLDAVSITAGPVLDTSTIGQTHVLVSVGVTTTPVVGTSTIGQEHVLVSVGIISTPVLGIPTISTDVYLVGVGITTTPVLGTPTVTSTADLISVGITSTPVLDTPTVISTANLTAIDITSTSVLGTPSIGQTHVLDAIDITADPVLGTPALSSEGEDNLEAEDITIIPVLGIPAIGQTHVLLATGISATTVLDTPTATLIYILDATNIETTPVVGTSVIGQTHALSSTGIVTTSEVGTPIFGQGHALDASGFITTPTLDVPIIAQIHALNASTVLVSPILGAPLIGQTHIIDAVGITTTPDMGVASWELVEGKAFIVFSAFQPELDFSTFQPELEFTISYTED